jgi:Leucine-rich repeat (LRR) protein
VQKLKNLRILNLKNNKITNIEILESLPNLTQVDLNNNAIPSEQLNKLNEKITFNRQSLKRRSFNI